MLYHRHEYSCANPGGGTGVPDTGFLCRTGSDPLKSHKATKPEFNVGPSLACQQNAI